MKVNLSMGKRAVSVNLTGLTRVCTKVYGKKIKLAARVSINGLTVGHIMESG